MMTDKFMVVLDDIKEAVARNCGLGGSGCTLGALERMSLLAKTSAPLEQVAQSCTQTTDDFQTSLKKPWLICFSLINSLT